MIPRHELKVGDRVFVWSPEWKRIVKVVVTKINSNTFQGQDNSLEKHNKLSTEKAYRPEEFRDAFPRDFYKICPNALPPHPTDYSDLKAFEKVFDAWAAVQNSDREISSATEIWEQEKNGTGLKQISVAESEPDSPLQVSGLGSPSISSAKSIPGAEGYLNSDIPELPSGQTSVIRDGEAGEEQLPFVLSAPHVSPSPLEEKGKAGSMSETASPQSLTLSGASTPDTSPLKTSPDSSIALSNQEAEPSILTGSLNSFPAAGMLLSGSLYPAPTLAAPGVAKDSLLLASPTALSSNGSGQPPGRNNLEDQMLQEGAIAPQEVANPEFLESGSGIPIGWTNPQEKRSALELLQETESTEPEEKRLGMLSILASPPSLSTESNILIPLPKVENIGALDKTTLLENAVAAHQAIALIERNEFALALSKLEQARTAGEMLTEFKRRCQHGEFDAELEKNGIGKSQAALYRRIAQNWDALMEKVRSAAPLEDCQILSLAWADKQMRVQKSPALPANPDHYRTPNNLEQPILSLVEQVFPIDLDPCADLGRAVPAKNHYIEQDDGLSQEWHGTVFMNPPFSDPLVWLDKLCCCFEDGRVPEAIALLKAGTIHNVGTGALIAKHASAVCNWRGRIAFLNEEGLAIKGSDFDCVLVYFGEGSRRFKEVFSPWGTVAMLNAPQPKPEVSRSSISSVEEEADAIQAQVEEMSGFRFGNGYSAMPEVEPNYDAIEAPTLTIQAASVVNEAALNNPNKIVVQTEWMVGFLSQVEDFSESQILEIWGAIADKIPLQVLRNFLDLKG